MSAKQEILTTIPVWQVLRLSMHREPWKLVTEGRDAYISDINVLPPPIRRLRLLVEPMRSTGYIEDSHQPGGLHSFFSMHHGALAPEILAALREVGFVRRANVFAEGMALFGADYPVANARRGKYFAPNFMGYADGMVPDPLASETAIDVALKQLSPTFGRNSDLKHDIEDYVASDLELSVFLAACTCGSRPGVGGNR